jgi:ATP phosphoribosyltransferase regulatory subunit
MTHPIPPGTRDVLPEEMRELRLIEARLREVFEAGGYGEVSTPAIEVADTLALGDENSAEGALRFFDKAGRLLALRTDMTLPIARVVADRLGDAELPIRLHYTGDVYRPGRDGGQIRELRQAGVELVGGDPVEGTAEVIEILVATLDAIGLDRAVVGLGDADLFAQLLAELEVGEDARQRILDRLAAHDLVAIETEAGALASLGEAERALLVRISGLRGGLEILEQARTLGGEAVARAGARLAATLEALERRGVADRVQIDLGLLRDLGYYTGAILEIYDPAVGEIIGGGGRYDDVMGRYGRPLPAAGFALYLERVHVAQAAEERLAGGDPRR